MTFTRKDIEAVIATNRFGMGARPGEINKLIDANITPREWLINSLSNIEPPIQAPSAQSMLQLWEKQRIQKKATVVANKDVRQEVVSDSKEINDEGMKANQKIKPTFFLKNNAGMIVKQAIGSDASINYRLLDFFSNHFSVSVKGNGLRFLAPSLDWDAIAPNIMGSFSDMLIAVTSHPAMLLYLDNDKSIGPNSKQGQKKKKLGLNENLAREIFELHTMGVNSGYTQNDIIELAKAITGWSFIRQPSESSEQVNQPYIYRKNSHEPGIRKVLSKQYLESKNSNKQAVLILEDLANHPKTALHVCTKLARHFTKDKPDIRLVKQMSSTWLKTNGDLRAVMETLIYSDLAWQTESLKYKSPREFLISAYRANTKKTLRTENKYLFNVLMHLGQQPYTAGSPAGFGDTRANWDGPDQLSNRIDWSVYFSSKQKKPSALKFAQTALGKSISKNTFDVIDRAESQRQAIALVLLSPEFLVR